MNPRNRDLTRREFMKLTAAGFAAAAVPGSALPNLADNESSLSHGERLADLFMRPPAESRPWCYWYWMNGNMTREGIETDLEGLARVGVGGVNYFDIGLLPEGAVINRSPEWYELVKFAVDEAAKRNIKVNLNCPGWSGSGGPWITPELAMKELSWSEITVEGEREFSGVLPQPPTRLNYYRDAAVIAFPTPEGNEPLPLPQAVDLDGKPLPEAVPALEQRAVLPAAVISQAPGVPGSAVREEDTEAAADLPVTFDLVFARPVEVRSLYVRGARASGSWHAQLSAWDDAQREFRPLDRFGSHAGGPFSTNIGSASFAPIRASKFRLSFENRRAGGRMRIEELRFSGGFRVTNWTCKAGFSSEPISPGANDCRPCEQDVIPLEEVVDLSSRLGSDGRLNWAVPAGRWTILRIGYTPAGIYLFPAPRGGTGLDCDKLSREAADFHYDHCVKAVLRELGPDLTKRAMAYYHVDSYESGWQNWTAEFPRDFRERRGYNLVKYLPAVTGRVVGSIETTEKFLWDFRRTIGDLFADNNYGRLAERCHEDGIGFSTEPYGGPFEQLQVASRADHPMTEIWLPGTAEDGKIWPQAVLGGRTAGRKILGSESFTSGPPAGGRWANHPFALKKLGDFIYCCGVNQYVVHVSTQQPMLHEHLRPGFTCGQNGIHFDRGNIWWEHGAKEWLSYATRCQSMLQQGEHVADVLYFQGNDSPAAVGPFDPALPDGYDFDDCSSETLADLTVRDGRVSLPSGKSYRYLVLPDNGRVTLVSLRKIHSLAQDGATVVGALPKESPSLSDQPNLNEYNRLVHELAAKMRVTQSFKEILAADNLSPDFGHDESAGRVLHYTHRRLADVDYYFVASPDLKAGVTECTFRITGKVPELWRADSGAIEPCAIYEQSGDVTRIPLHFDPHGSVFVVFRPGSPELHATSVSIREAAGDSATSAGANQPAVLRSMGGRLELHAWQAGKYAVTTADGQTRHLEIAAMPVPQTAQGPWTLRFPAGWEAPEQITLEKLISWPDSSDPGIRYFSGTATYKTTFPSPTIEPGCRLFLDLGRVEVIAEVALNGEFLGTLWKPPFLCDISKLIRSEGNELEVRITNLWPNRLIGDEQFPDDCSPDGTWKSGVIPAWPEWLKSGKPRPEPRRLTFCTWKHWRRNDPLLPSGLLGPVVLRQVKTVAI